MLTYARIVTPKVFSVLDANILVSILVIKKVIEKHFRKMTKEEFDKLEDKWQTVYLDGKTPIRMVSKRSSKKDCILWYDSDECSHTAHYSRIEVKQCEHQKAIDTFAKEKYPLEDGIEEAGWNARQCELRDAFKAGFIKSEKVFLEKACEWMMNFKLRDEFPLYDYVGNFRKAMEG